jgi:hypothetical protein
MADWPTDNYPLMRHAATTASDPSQQHDAWPFKLAETGSVTQWTRVGDSAYHTFQESGGVSAYERLDAQYISCSTFVKTGGTIHEHVWAERNPIQQRFASPGLRSTRRNDVPRVIWDKTNQDYWREQAVRGMGIMENVYSDEKPSFLPSLMDRGMYLEEERDEWECGITGGTGDAHRFLSFARVWQVDSLLIRECYEGNSESTVYYVVNFALTRLSYEIQHHELCVRLCLQGHQPHKKGLDRLHVMAGPSADREHRMRSSELLFWETRGKNHANALALARYARRHLCTTFKTDHQTYTVTQDRYMPLPVTWRT